jgi:hypothetical protein
VIHLILDGVRLKTVPSRLSLSQLHQLLVDGGSPTGPPPVAVGPVVEGAAIEVERTINGTGLVALAGRRHPVGFTSPGDGPHRPPGAAPARPRPDGPAIAAEPLSRAEAARIRDARPVTPGSLAQYLHPHPPR